MNKLLNKSQLVLLKISMFLYFDNMNEPLVTTCLQVWSTRLKGNIYSWCVLSAVRETKYIGKTVVSLWGSRSLYGSGVCVWRTFSCMLNNYIKRNDWTFDLSHRIQLFVLLQRFCQQPWLPSGRSSFAGMTI